MAERATVNEVTQIGAEVTAGTAVSANRLLRCSTIEPTPVVPREPYQPMGFKVNTTAIAGKEHTEADLSGRLCYNDLVYFFSSILEQATISTPSGATAGRRWTFVPSSTAPDTVVSFTVEKGGPNGAERFTYGLVDSLSITWNQTEASLGGSMIGRQLTEGITLTGSPTVIDEQVVDQNTVSFYVGSALTNEVQTVTIGTHTGGTYTLTFVGPEGDSATTAAIAYDANAAAVTSALEALANINAGDVLVAGASSPWTVTFQGRLASYNQELMTIDGALLTGGSGQTVTQTTAGGLTKLLRCYSFSLNIGNRWEPGFTLDAAQDSFSHVVEVPIDATAELILQHDSASVAFMGNLRSKDTLFCRMIAHGPNVEAGYPHRIQLTFPFKFTGSDRGDQDAVWASTYAMAVMHSSSLAGGTWIEAVVDNGLTAL